MTIMKKIAKEDLMKCYSESGRCEGCRLTQAVKQLPNGIDANMDDLVENVLDPVASVYDKPIEICHAFCCPVRVKYVKDKDDEHIEIDHIKGEAVDLAAVGLEGNDLRLENLEIAKVIVQTVVFDEMVLLDVPTSGIEPKMIHVSYKKGGKHRKVVLKRVIGKSECEELTTLDKQQLFSQPSPLDLRPSTVTLPL